MNKKREVVKPPFVCYVYCPATTAQVSFVPDPPTVAYAKRNFLCGGNA